MICKTGLTNACILMVKETIQYYLQNDNNVYGTGFDATKAFDRIDFSNCFQRDDPKRNTSTCYTFDYGNVRETKYDSTVEQ